MDIRKETAKYYDLWSLPFDDIPFYVNRIPSAEVSILELGCGTGRVLSRLVEHCAFIHGLDISPAMIVECRERILELGIAIEKVKIEANDITDFDLGHTFDLIIAPYRVFQNVEIDDQVDGLFQCIRKHLSPDGSCILNVMHPRPVDLIQESWGEDTEIFCLELPFQDGYVTCHERRQHFDAQKLVMYPESIYRRYVDGKVIETATQRICMRLYYPEDLGFAEKVLDGSCSVGEFGDYLLICGYEGGI
jgi:cyclopropane fatty-acyl-phospholipid synthase-like methyltransferase